ncbi:MAG: MFS transporter [Spirochaetes bacterium]|jgi:oligogalacturonide transporter|nr:MFS transporter [Spirochaetota bacterium]
MSTLEQREPKLGFWRKAGFGIGDFYGGGAFIVVGSYYLFFLTDVVRINPALAGFVVLIGRVWDAISDPLMGFLSDRTRTRWGRRRPYMLAGILLVFASFVLLWYPSGLDTEIGRFFIAVISYLFFSTIITMVMIPYNALASELTLDYNERTSLSAFRIVFSSISSVVCAVLPLEIVSRFPTQSEGFVAMAIFFGVFFALPFLAVFFATKEREEFQRSVSPFSFKTMLVEPFRNSPFVKVLLMYVLAFVAIDILNSVVIYFMTHYLNRGGETQYVLGTLLVAQLASIPGYTWLSRQTGKRAAYVVAVVLWLVTMPVSFLLGPGQASFWIYLFAAVVGVATGGIVVMLYSMFPDMPDVDELLTGRRREGIYSGLLTFTRKLASAIGVFGLSQALAIAGYAQPVEKIIDGVPQNVPMPQTEGFILILRFIFGIAPLLFLGAALFVALKYPLSPDVHNRLKAFLAARRGTDVEEVEGDLPQVRADDETERELKTILGVARRKRGGEHE